MKLILRLWRAKLAFHPLSPKKKHCINAHYAETWGLFEIASLFAIFVCALVCAPPPICPLLPRLHSLFPRTPRLRRPHFTHARAHSRVHSRTPAPPPISVFCLHPSPLYPNSLFIKTQGVNISPTSSPSPSLHLPSRDSPQPATEKPHFFQHFPRISLATLPASPTAKSATEQVKVFSSKPSPLTL